MRWIAHVDMDSFFVAVERLRHPNLVGKPMVVGGSGPRAVVASASYEARKFGVRSAMPMSQARRLCPNLAIVRPDISEYSRLSKMIFSELINLAPVVEQVSIDEAYLDFSGCEKIYPSREAAARKVKESILETSQLTSTVGVSTNKLLAKIASDFAKPDGLFVVPTGEERKFLAPMSVRKLPGVGPKTGQRLELLNIKTCDDLATASEKTLRALGTYIFELQQMARGIDTRVVSNEGERKSLASEETFDVDISDMTVLFSLIRKMSEDLASQLRKENLKTKTIQLKIRYPDFSTITRAKTINECTNISSVISDVATELLRQNKNSKLPLRLLGVSVKNFEDTNQPPPQLNFFEQEESEKKKDRVERLKDELRSKHGPKALL